MYVLFDLIPTVEHTGESQLHGQRSYYFLEQPAIQFVLWDMDWADLKVGNVFDANWGVSDFRGGCKKLTLRTRVTASMGAPNPTSAGVTRLSELINEADRSRRVPPLIVYLKEDEREKFESVKSFYPGLTEAQLVRMMIRQFKTE